MLSHFRISSNAIYPFLTESRKFCFLRLSPTAEKAPAEVDSELRFILWLREKGYPVMKPYPMKDGRLSGVVETEWGSYNVTCFENVEGDTPEDETAAFPSLTAMEGRWQSCTICRKNTPARTNGRAASTF